MNCIRQQYPFIFCFLRWQHEKRQLQTVYFIFLRLVLVERSTPIFAKKTLFLAFAAAFPNNTGQVGVFGGRGAIFAKNNFYVGGLKYLSNTACV